MTLCRKGHPRMDMSESVIHTDAAPDALALHRFLAEQHALVSAVGTGHGYANAERVLEATLPCDQIVCRVPTFTAAALIAKNSDVITTVPRTVGLGLARDLDLMTMEPPLALPSMEIAQYWHDRFHRDSGNEWLRSVFRRLFIREPAQAA